MPSKQYENKLNPWYPATIKSLNRFVESNSPSTTTSTNGLNNSYPRLGSLLIVQASIFPLNQSNNQNSGSNNKYDNKYNSDIWSESTPDLRPGDLLLIKGPHLGYR